MGIGGALSFNAVDSVLAAGVAAGIPPIPPVAFTAISVLAANCLGAIEPTVTIGYKLPTVNVDFNVLVNGFKMTAEADGFGDLDITGDLGLTKTECSPEFGAIVDSAQTAANILVNQVKAAIPDVEPLVENVAAIVDSAKMKMQTATTNVMLYYNS